MQQRRVCIAILSVDIDIFIVDQVFSYIVLVEESGVKQKVFFVVRVELRSVWNQMVR